MIKASFFERLFSQKVRCLLCPHECLLSEGQSGICGARVNVGGNLMTRNYGVVSAFSLDPIEKKPLYHYHPGESILSVGTVGCNLHCPFCQNDSLSRFYDQKKSVELPILTSDEMLQKVEESGSFGLAYTYSEPVVWYEFVRECAEKLFVNGFKNVLVTNGFINSKPLKTIIPFIHAVNIDLKAFDESAYLHLGGRLAPVLETITLMKEAGVHIEITTLVVPGINANLDQLRNLFHWIAALDPNIPLHISRYFPHYHYTAPPTPLSEMERVAKEARSILNYVYIGNVVESADTFCPYCNAILVKRHIYQTSILNLKIQDHHAVCGVCGRETNFILT